jgi:hypothetical protein
MVRSSKSYKSILSLVIFLLLSSAATAQKKSKEELPQGKPVLWESVNISRRNLLTGPGGEKMRPNLSQITFIEEEKGGWSKKYRIKDGAGNVWVAKIGKEAQSETAAVRLVWALGYKTEVNYLVPKITIPGKGTFTNVRLEARPKEIKRLDEWKWKRNPFTGSNELKGLVVMMAFLNNWDLKDSNNKILHVKDRGELQYVISDLGATFGKIGNLPLFWRIQRSRNKPTDYRDTKLVSKVSKEREVKFKYHGKMRELMDDITVKQARWVLNLLSQLSDEQIRDAFRAANYSRNEVDILTREVKDRIAELNTATKTTQAKM